MAVMLAGGHRLGPVSWRIRGEVHSALALARLVTGLPGLRFEGITGYEGHCSLTIDNELRRERQREAMGFFVSVAEMLEADGILRRTRSAGGVATWEWTSTFPGITEIQAGTWSWITTTARWCPASSTR